MHFGFPLILVLKLVLLNSCGGTSDTLVSNHSPSTSVLQLEKQVAHSIDNERVKRGFKRLVLDSRISSLARNHSKYLARQAEKKGRLELNHDGARSRFNTIMLDYAMSRAAENVAYLEPRAQAPVIRFTAMWVISSKHHKNMMQDWNYTGVGIHYTKDGAIFATQIFALKTDYTF